jgi:hypothetical protein
MYSYRVRTLETVGPMPQLFRMNHEMPRFAPRVWSRITIDQDLGSVIGFQCVARGRTDGKQLPALP